MREFFSFAATVGAGGMAGPSRWRALRFVIVTDKRQHDVTIGFVVGVVVLLVALIGIVRWAIKLAG